MQPLIIGHRGASSGAPENTMASFRLALAADADGIEFDVRLTKEGVPVVIHDDNLQRTGRSPKRVANLSLAELRQIDVGSWFTPGRVEYSDEKVPTLSEVLELCEPTQALLYLEMKSDPSQRLALADACCESLKKTSLKDRVIIESFDLAAIEIVKEINSDIKTAALFEPALKSPPIVGSARKLVDKALAVSADEIALHHRLANKRTVDVAKAEGFNVVVWTVDDRTWIERAHSTGIDALITNDPGSMVRWRNNANAD